MPLVIVKKSFGNRFIRNTRWILPLPTLRHFAWRELGSANKWNELFEPVVNAIDMVSAESAGVMK